MAIRNWEHSRKHWALVVNDQDDRLFATLGTGTLEHCRRGLDDLAGFAALDGSGLVPTVVARLSEDAMAIRRGDNVEFYRIVKEG